MLICSIGWILFSFIGAIPFTVALDISYLDSMFESASGFTTTGITILTKLETMPRSILFWRCFSQWFGGLGILAFFLSVVYKKGSAHRLMGAEGHKIGIGRPVPGIANTIRILWTIYIGFTIFMILFLSGLGMDTFDSICHGMTAISTGGFSNYDRSIGHFRFIQHTNFIAIEYALIFGMILGGINFLIHYRVLTGDIKALWDNIEMKYWWFFMSFFVLLIIFEKFMRHKAFCNFGFNRTTFILFEENFRAALFQVTSFFTTAGFLTIDICNSFFGMTSKHLFIIIMFIGGCVGSTSGGFKILRIIILQKLAQKEIFRMLIPRKAISTIIIDGKPVDTSEIQRVASFFFLWIFFITLGVIVTSLFSSMNGYKAISGMFSIMGNIGPSYISVAETQNLHPVLKIFYIFGMLAGRLEILPLILLFMKRSWQ